MLLNWRTEMCVKSSLAVLHSGPALLLSASSCLVKVNLPAQIVGTAMGMPPPCGRSQVLVGVSLWRLAPQQQLHAQDSRHIHGILKDRISTALSETATRNAFMLGVSTTERSRQAGPP